MNCCFQYDSSKNWRDIFEDLDDTFQILNRSVMHSITFKSILVLSHPWLFSFFSKSYCKIFRMVTNSTLLFQEKGFYFGFCLNQSSWNSFVKKFWKSNHFNYLRPPDSSLTLRGVEHMHYAVQVGNFGNGWVKLVLHGTVFYHRMKPPYDEMISFRFDVEFVSLIFCNQLTCWFCYNQAFLPHPHPFGSWK